MVLRRIYKLRKFIFEYAEDEINPQYRNPKKKNVLLGFALLYGIMHRKSGSSGGGFAKQTDRRQNCISKTHVSYSKNAHVEQIKRYLKREGVGKDGKTPELFGTSEEEYQKKMVDKNFRIFLSPANGKVPLETLAKKFIEKLQLQTDYDLYWVGAEHHNTAHPHVHILINGIDKKGQDVRFSRDMIKTIMREMSRDICTSLVGNRTKEDMKLEKLQTLNANRFTYFDRQLKEWVSDENILETGKIKKDKELYDQRLNHLVHMGLCSYKDEKYQFTKGWDETLRTLGRYNIFLTAKKNLKFSNPHNYELFEEKTGAVSGIVTKIYKTDEISNNHAAIIESIDGKAYFVPLFYKPQFKENHYITITPKKNEKGRLSPFANYETKKTLLKKTKEKGYKEGAVTAFLKNEKFQENAKQSKDKVY